jgi:hypothetical protein
MKDWAVDMWKTLRVSHIPTATTTTIYAYAHKDKTKEEKEEEKEDFSNERN